MKKLTILGLALTTLLLASCGSPSDNDSMSETTKTMKAQQIALSKARQRLFYRSSSRKCNSWRQRNDTDFSK